MKVQTILPTCFIHQIDRLVIFIRNPIRMYERNRYLIQCSQLYLIDRSLSMICQGNKHWLPEKLATLILSHLPSAFPFGTSGVAGLSTTPGGSKSVISLSDFFIGSGSCNMNKLVTLRRNPKSIWPWKAVWIWCKKLLLCYCRRSVQAAFD